ncbi:MAG: DUF3251 domain-containing protein [bacterium]|nr:DUF3251 domain-containing protein [bacterium]
MAKVLFVLLCAVACIFTGCAKESRVEYVEAEINTLRGQVDSLKARVLKIEFENSMNDFFKDLDKFALLTPGADGYSIIQTDVGRMSISLEDVQAYASGTRVRLQFGNLTSATVNGLGAKLDWGRMKEQGGIDKATEKSREVKFTQSLRPGSWTNIQVVLEGVPPAEFGYVRISEVTHTGISMMKN